MRIASSGDIMEPLWTLIQILGETRQKLQKGLPSMSKKTKIIQIKDLRFPSLQYGSKTPKDIEVTRKSMREMIGLMGNIGRGNRF